MNRKSKKIILSTVVPLFNVKEGVDKHNVGYVQGVIHNRLPFAAEVWRYEDEQTLVVYLPDLSMIDREDYIVGNQEENTKEEFEPPKYDLSVLARFMTCKSIEGIFEVNEFYKEYLEELGIFEFTSNRQNGYVTYYEHKNGLKIIAFSVLLRTGKEVLAKCLLPLIPFEEAITDNSDEAEEWIIVK